MKQIRLLHLLLLLLTLLSVHTGWSQGTTTSSMSGVITDQSGAGLPGATVIAVHTPTNTQYVAPTNSDGRFNLQNMRVGGPYTVRVTFVGYQDVTREGIYLTLGQTQRLDINLSETSTQLAGVTVTGTDPRSILNAERSGSVTNIGTQELQRLPSITRNLNDFLRLTPQSSGTNAGAIGGGNYRQNNVTVDGADFNNNFGIGGNLPAGGNPISLDAIEEITVNVTPFDVRQSNFIGSAVNAVTRSGTNNFSGSVYTFWRNQNQQGNRVGPDEFVKQKLDDKQYGFRLGGPIIKDKVFFFVNAERRDATSPGQQNLASTDALPFGGPNTPSNIVRPTETRLNEISNYLREQYGYETGPYQGYSFKSQRTNILGRVDWNINTNNRFTVRYSQVTSKAPSFVSTSRSPLTAFTNTRLSNFALPFANSNYYQEQNLYSLAAELNSTIRGKFFNTARFTYTNQNDPRSSDSEVFPFVDILEQGNPYTSFGYEPFTYGNLREVKTFSGVDFVNFSLGRNNITAGIQVDVQNTRNGFQRFGTSYYTFDSWDAFRTGGNPSSFALTYSLLPGFEQAYPRFKFAQGSVYAQDEFTVNDKLRLTAGLRLERNMYLDVNEIQTHPLVASLTFANGEHIDTGTLPNNRTLWSPRFGFNYDVKGNRTLQIRGGSGIFSGRVPTVWLVAQSGDSGLLQFTTTATATATAPITDRKFDPNPAAYRPQDVPTPGTQVPSTVSTTDRNFRNPQVWKSSLAVDAQLPGGVVGTLEGIYNKDLIVALGRNPNLVDPQALNIVGYPDKRNIYPNSVSTRFINPLTSASAANPNQPVANGNASGTQAFNPVVLYNRHKGYYWSASAKLDKRFSNGIVASAAYVRSQQKVLFDGSGDQLLNTWSNTAIINNSNNPELSYSNYVVPSRFIVSLSYRKEYIKHLGTQISVFYEGSTQGRFSYIYGGDFNRDGQTNDLLYIPKDATEINFSDFNYGTAAAPKTYTAAQQSELFFRYLEQDEYLNSHRGQYAERNGAKFPWRNQFDVRFAQDIFASTGDKRNTLQFTIDVFNFGNLLNRNWGLVQTLNTVSNGNAAILVPTNITAPTNNPTLPLYTPNGTVRPTFRLATDRNQPVTTTFRNTIALASTYYMQFGLRYTFN
ncbi:TonB-dependent receptor [Hymenobacter sp. GOD-10R]|uniref:TonB-dependent receptor n=1 Tax=Hymenobacter sp. GOD-10R TaxID=3093922 RepID=UPI002D781169|nr:carboxypeptidase regulatory-like domain-containing protein [Hymenobacter sp. GOD-10R]WRQ27474.1 carboxypeptidase regulatory-like domain-containing protein [Hymenobacter sp. GOD-10R]